MKVQVPGDRGEPLLRPPAGLQATRRAGGGAGASRLRAATLAVQLGVRAAPRAAAAGARSAAAPDAADAEGDSAEFVAAAYVDDAFAGDLDSNRFKRPRLQLAFDGCAAPGLLYHSAPPCRSTCRRTQSVLERGQRHRQTILYASWSN